MEREEGSGELRQHGVSFETATEVFLDDERLYDLDDSSDEERWRTIGLAAGKILFVVYTEPADNVVRIISAREATKREERRYFGQAST